MTERSAGRWRERGRPGVVAGILAAALISAAGLQARPIRTNTPGTGVFIGSGVVAQGICDSSSGDAASELTGCRLVGDFRYTPATHWVFGVRAPLWVEREADLGDRQVARSGVGDVEISGKWRFFRQVGAWFDRHAAVEVGLKLPTGKSDALDPGLPLPLAHRLTPGTGSTDAFVDLIYQQGQRRFVWGGDLLYRWNGEGEEEYRFGDLLKLSFDVEYVVFPREYRKPGNEVFVLLEWALVHREEDERPGGELPTGGTELLLAPGIQHIATEQMLLSLSVRLPVWSDLDPAGLESDWNVLAEVRYAF